MRSRARTACSDALRRAAGVRVMGAAVLWVVGSAADVRTSTNRATAPREVSQRPPTRTASSFTTAPAGVRVPLVTQRNTVDGSTVPVAPVAREQTTSGGQGQPSAGLNFIQHLGAGIGPRSSIGHGSPPRNVCDLMNHSRRCYPESKDTKGRSGTTFGRQGEAVPSARSPLGSDESFPAGREFLNDSAQLLAREPWTRNEMPRNHLSRSDYRNRSP